jgi:hypothetical protein
VAGVRLPRPLRGLAMTRGVRGLAMTGWVLAAPLSAQAPPPIQEQQLSDRRGVQPGMGRGPAHQSVFPRQGRGLVVRITQEWPFRGQRHQLSYTVPILHSSGAGDGLTGLGDLALSTIDCSWWAGESRLWVAPRLSVTLPTGRWQAGRGAGVAGVQMALPMSLELSPRLVTHLNAGVSLPPARAGRERRSGDADILLRRRERPSST